MPRELHVGAFHSRAEKIGENYRASAQAQVGTAYAKQGKAQAMAIGLAKIRKKGGMDALAARAAGGAPRGSLICVYCWRGGLRSGAVAWLLRRRGYDARVMAGGHRAYRAWLRSLFDAGPRVVIVGGRTGAGKTRALRALAEAGHQVRGGVPRRASREGDAPGDAADSSDARRGGAQSLESGAQVLDLEGLAEHRGSAFGSRGAQPSNVAFESRVARSGAELPRRASRGGLR